MSEIKREDVLPALLVADDERSRDEPEIAANISTQLEHMGLHTWSISVIRRLRDAVGRLEPTSVLEIGASIGHRSAWLFDLFTTNNQRNSIWLNKGLNSESFFSVFNHDMKQHLGQTYWLENFQHF